MYIQLHIHYLITCIQKEGITKKKYTWKEKLENVSKQCLSTELIPVVC